MDPLAKLNRFVILQDSKLKVVWDVFVMFVLITVTIIIPYRLAFDVGDGGDPIEWVIIYYIFDFIFAVDIVLCFLTSYTNSYHKTEIVSHKAIAKNYMTGWFTIDLVSVIPFDALL
jgi:hypothetical protein